MTHLKVKEKLTAYVSTRNGSQMLHPGDYVLTHPKPGLAFSFSLLSFFTKTFSPAV